MTLFTAVEYAHVPNVNTIDGVLDLLSACILAILGNVLDFRTYSAPNQKDDKPMTDAQHAMMVAYDRNDIPHNERMAVCYVRGVALSLFDWVRWRLLITGPDGDVLADLPSRFLMQILKSVVNYKSRAMRMKIRGAPHCETRTVRTQAANVVRCDSILKGLWKHGEGIPEDQLEIEDKDRYVVQKRQGPSNKPLDPSEFQTSAVAPV